MADIIEQPSQEAQTASIPAGIPPEVHEQMQISLGNIPNANAEVAAAAQTPVEPVTPPVTPTENPFSFDIFKNEFNYENPEQIVEDIRNFKNLQAQPPVAEIKWEGDNVEESKNIFENLRTGNYEPLYNFLSEQQKLNALTSQEINESNAPDIIKLQMGLKYKELSQSEINYKFNKMYGIPSEPVIGADEDPDDFQIRHSEWKEKVTDIKTSMTIDAKLAKPELLSFKKELVLPSISQPQGDPNYDNFQKEWELLDKEFAASQQAVKSFTPDSFGIKMPFIDEANKIAFDFQYVPDQESFSKTVQAVSNDPLRSNAYRNPDGTIDSKASFRDEFISKNFEKIIAAAMTQAKNAAIKSMLPDNSAGSGMSRVPLETPGEKTELQKQMELSLGRYMPKPLQHN